jgi:putative Mn2+ efflux pump MntP
MSFLEILLLAVSMAMDAFTVSLGAGSLPETRGPRPTFRLAFHFGLFQFLMPVLGWLAGASIEPLISGVDHWIAFALLAFVGVRMIAAARRPAGVPAADPSRGWTLVLLSVAVSLDALAVGLSLGVLGIPVGYPALVIGLTTGLLSLAGLRLGQGIGRKLGRPFQIIGGVLLIGIGLRIFVLHLTGA